MGVVKGRRISLSKVFAGIGWLTVAVVALFVRYAYQMHPWAGSAGPLTSSVQAVWDVGAVIVGFALFWRFKLRGALAKNVPRPEIATEGQVVQEAVRRIIDSEHFFTAMRDTVPSAGSADKGMEHVPFILRTLNRSRKREERKATAFLLATVGAGTAFAALVAFYGWVLVDEKSAGFPSAVASLSDAVETLDELMAANRGPRYQEARSKIVDYMRETFHVIKYESDMPMEVATAIWNVQSKLKYTLLLESPSTDDLIEVGGEIDEMPAEVVRKYTGTPGNIGEYFNHVASLRKKIEQLTLLRQGAKIRTEQALELVQDIAKDAAALSASSPIRIAEIVKRATVGFVVISFFFAILRYVAGLYREARGTVMQFATQEVGVRRFCLALASAQPGSVRDEVIRRFVSPVSSHPGVDAEEALKEAADRQYEIAKELIGIVKKKVD